MGPQGLRGNPGDSCPTLPRMDTATPSRDPVERLSQLAADVESFSHDADDAFGAIAEALHLIADELGALRNPQ